MAWQNQINLSQELITPITDEVAPLITDQCVDWCRQAHFAFGFSALFKIAIGISLLFLFAVLYVYLTKNPEKSMEQIREAHFKYKLHKDPTHTYEWLKFVFQVLIYAAYILTMIYLLYHRFWGVLAY